MMVALSWITRQRSITTFVSGKVISRRDFEATRSGSDFAVDVMTD